MEECWLKERGHYITHSLPLPCDSIQHFYNNIYNGNDNKVQGVSSLFSKVCYKLVPGTLLEMTWKKIKSYIPLGGTKIKGAQFPQLIRHVGGIVGSANNSQL